MLSSNEFAGVIDELSLTEDAFFGDREFPRFVKVERELVRCGFDFDKHFGPCPCHVSDVLRIRAARFIVKADFVWYRWYGEGSVREGE